MKTSLDQFCINVSNLERSVEFYGQVLGLEITHRIEIPNVSEVVLAGASGNRIQLAWHHDHSGPIDHGNALWKLYVYTDDIAGVYAAAMDYGSESVMAPTRLEKWPVTAAFVRDPDGYLVQLMQRHA